MGGWYGYAMVIASSVLFGASSVIIKHTYSTGLAPVPVIIIQGIISSLVAWGWVLLSKKSPRLPKGLWPWMAAQGTVGGFLTSVLFYTSLEVLGAALATLLLFTYPAFVVIYNTVFRKHHLTLPEKGALVMALAGILFCVDLPGVQLESVTALALLMALGSAVTNAFLSINGERLLAVLETPVVTAWSLSVSTLTMLVVYRPVWLADVSLSGYQILLVVGGALLFVLPLMVYLTGLRRIGAGIASIISTAEIPFTLVLAWAFLQESLNVVQVLGGGLITLSVFVLYYYRVE
jgi:drug/metabolite transporter (DMT)-like permease